jgi:hypothetical protein
VFKFCIKFANDGSFTLSTDPAWKFAITFVILSPKPLSILSISSIALPLIKKSTAS